MRPDVAELNETHVSDMAAPRESGMPDVVGNSGFAMAVSR